MRVVEPVKLLEQRRKVRRRRRQRPREAERAEPENDDRTGGRAVRPRPGLARRGRRRRCRRSSARHAPPPRPRRAARPGPSPSTAPPAPRRRSMRPGARRARGRSSPLACPRSTMRWIVANASRISSTWPCKCGLRATSRTITRTRSGSLRHVRRRIFATPRNCSGAGSGGRLNLVEALEQLPPVLAEDRCQHLVLGGEVVVEQAVRDAGLLRDVTDARRVVALAGEHPHRGVEDQPALVGRQRLNGQSNRVQLRCTLAARATARGDPGRGAGAVPAGGVRRKGAAPARRARRPRRGARRRSDAPYRRRVGRGAAAAEGIGRLRAARGPAVRTRPVRPRRRRAGGLPARRRSPARARPGAAARSVVYCSITGFGADGPHARRAGHDLNYLGWAGVLEDTAPSPPPVQVADLAAGALGAVTEVLAALVRRERTGAGGHLVVSMTHGSHDLVAHRLGGEPVPRLLTGGLACYRVYATADERQLTVAALEPKFFARLCEVVGRHELAERQYDADQQALGARAGRDLRDAHARRVARPLRRRGRLHRSRLDTRGSSRGVRLPRPGG